MPQPGDNSGPLPTALGREALAQRVVALEFAAGGAGGVPVGRRKKI